MPPSAPIVQKRGRPPKLRAAASLPLPALDKNCVDLAKAPNVRQQGGPPPTLPPTVPTKVQPGMLPTVLPPMPPTVKPSIVNRELPDAVKRAAKPPAPESSNARRVSNRTTKGQPPIRFGQSGYVAFLIAILFLFLVNNASASPIPSWNNISSEELPILDGAVLWHPLERAILLNGYQFVIVAYKVLPPKTSGGTFLCGGAYNSTEIAAPDGTFNWNARLKTGHNDRLR